MRKVVSTVTLLVVLSALAAPAATHAGDSFSQTRFGSDFFQVSPPCPVKQFPTFETIAPVPAIFDTDVLSSAVFQCFVDVSKNNRGRKKAKGTWTTELIVRDNNTGELETFDIASGRFKTDSNGQDEFDFEIPAPIFADGFESGDVSAWSYTRSDFTNKKKADRAIVQCGKAASRSD